MGKPPIIKSILILIKGSSKNRIFKTLLLMSCCKGGILLMAFLKLPLPQSAPDLVDSQASLRIDYLYTRSQLKRFKLSCIRYFYYYLWNKCSYRKKNYSMSTLPLKKIILIHRKKISAFAGFKKKLAALSFVLFRIILLMLSFFFFHSANFFCYYELY